MDGKENVYSHLKNGDEKEKEMDYCVKQNNKRRSKYLKDLDKRKANFGFAPKGMRQDHRHGEYWRDVKGCRSKGHEFRYHAHKRAHLSERSTRSILHEKQHLERRMCQLKRRLRKVSCELHVRAENRYGFGVSPDLRRSSRS